MAQDKFLSNSFGLELVLIPAGTFIMGSTAPFCENSVKNESPARQVTISRSFYFGKYLVTQGQWRAVMGNNPFAYTGRTNPAENVSWEDIQVFIQKLNLREKKGEYRFPTEAEWEYAARAGTKTPFFWGDDPSALDSYAHYRDNTRLKWVNRHTGEVTKWTDGRPQPVGGKRPNPWGLYDIYGNIWEWVEDWYGEYQAGAVTDPTGPATGSGRVIRGGSWITSAEFCRSAYRFNCPPDFRTGNLGFRLAFSPK